MKSRIADPPLRQLTRLRSEIGIASAQQMAVLFDGHWMLGLEYGIVARVCLVDWTAGRGLARPEAPTQAIPIRKLALSLGAPPESTRRRVNLLLDRGALVSSPQGVSLATTAEGEALAMAYYLGTHDLFVRLIEDMAATCDLDLPVAETCAFGVADVTAAAIDTLLLPIDTFRLATRHGPGLLIWGGLATAAVRDVTYDPVLSRRYAAVIPPDRVRLGVSLHGLAAALSIPYATAWRQAQALEKKGLATRLGSDRWTVLTRNLLHESVGEISNPPSMLMLGKIRALAALGFDPARAAEYYQGGRPPLAEVGLSQNG